MVTDQLLELTRNAGIEQPGWFDSNAGLELCATRRNSMDKRFTALRPQTCNFGSEPPLLDIIAHYYTSHGIEPMKAKKLAHDYVREWVKAESSNFASPDRPPI